MLPIYIVKNLETTKNGTKIVLIKPFLSFTEKLLRMGFISYEDYLRSKHWREFRKNYSKSNEMICYVCGNEATELHHHNYERIGEELQEDVVPLCRFCHSEVHDFCKHEGVSLSEAHKLYKKSYELFIEYHNRKDYVSELIKLRESLIDDKINKKKEKIKKYFNKPVKNRRRRDRNYGKKVKGYKKMAKLKYFGMAQKLYREGMSLRQIAKQVSLKAGYPISYTTIRKWLIKESSYTSATSPQPSNCIP